jgi:rSAM/selenodomain-associated transferase 2
MKLSIIIPTLDEEANLPHSLSALPSEAEVIVVDGLSRDRTREIALQWGARVIESRPGRGAQMNVGAGHSSGDVLLFLHADCVLGPRAAGLVEKALHRPGVVGGSFRLHIDHPGWGYRLVAFGSNLRARLFGLPYGDQALFVRRSDFDAIGGFPEDPLMEDVVLVRRLRQRGKLVAIDETVTTGPRHWQHLGPLLTTLLNWTTVSLYFLGISPARLAPWYHRLRKGKQALEEHSEQPAFAPHDRNKSGATARPRRSR